jgi:hypothetical protein
VTNLKRCSLSALSRSRLLYPHEKSYTPPRPIPCPANSRDSGSVPISPSLLAPIKCLDKLLDSGIRRHFKSPHSRSLHSWIGLPRQSLPDLLNQPPPNPYTTPGKLPYECCTTPGQTSIPPQVHPVGFLAQIITNSLTWLSPVILLDNSLLAGVPLDTRLDNHQSNPIRLLYGLLYPAFLLALIKPDRPQFNF